jgi:hypothetical protein
MLNPWQGVLCAIGSMIDSLPRLRVQYKDMCAC